MRELYRSGDYARLNPDWHRDDAGAKAAGLLTVLGDWGLLGRSVVEWGCGTGEVLRALAAAQPDVPHQGWDIAAAPLEGAAETANLSLVVGALLDSDAAAELGLALDVLEHVADPVASLAALARHAEHWVLRMPLERSLRAVVRPGRLERSRRDLGHLHHWDWAQAIGVVHEAGFRVERVRVDHPRPRGGVVGRVETWLRGRLDPMEPRLAPWLVGGDSLWVYASPRT